MLFVFDDFEFHEENFELRRAGQIVKVDALALRLLTILLRRPGQLVTKEELVDEAWDGRPVGDNVIAVSMGRLRKALHDRRGEQETIATVYGRGYRFVRPVTAHNAVANAALAQGDPRPTAPPCVGRTRVLEILRAALGAASTGRGRACVLMGEPGIGKTHVVEAFEQSLMSSPVRMRWGFCREAGDTPPIWPWRSILRGLIAASTSGPSDLTLTTARTELIGLLDALDASEAQPGEAANMVSTLNLDGALRHRLFAAVTRFLGKLSEPMPVVLAFEDLHRADPTTLGLLRHLLDEIALTRVLVVATVRSTARTSRDNVLPEVLGHRNCERISLERLARAEVAEYVGSQLDDSDGELSRMVFDKSEGNPFFMAELVRQLRAGDRAQSDVLEVSNAALELVRQHVARLDDDARGVLSIAAVIGRSFELGLLQAVSAQDARDLMDSLDSAIQAEIVVPAPDSRSGFAFGHELIRGVLYEGLPPAQRRSLHLRVAEALEGRVHGGELARPSELAFHYRAALPDTDLQKTVHYCRAAAGAAATVFCLPDVLRYLRYALEALDLMERPSVRLRLHLLYVITMYARGLSSREFLRAIEELVKLAREHRDGNMLVRAALMLNPHPGLPPAQLTRPLLELGQRLLPFDDEAMQAVTLAALAGSAPYCFDREHSRTMIDKAIRCAERSGSRGASYVALIYKLSLVGSEPEGLQTVEQLELLAMHNPQRMPVLPIDVAMYHALRSLVQGDRTSMRAAIERAEARSRELGHVELAWHARRFLAISLIDGGAWSAGSALLTTLHREAVQLSILGSEPFRAFDRAVVLGELADVRVLDDSTRRALGYDQAAPPNLWAMKLRAHAAIGSLDEVRIALRAVPVEQLERLPRDTCYLGTLGHLVHACCRIGAVDYCEELYRLLEPHAEQFAGEYSFLCAGSVAQLLGMLAHALGRHTQALAHFERGVALCERAGFVRAAAEARLSLARCLFERGHAEDRAQVRALAGAVREGAEGHGSARMTRAAAALIDGTCVA